MGSDVCHSMSRSLDVVQTVFVGGIKHVSYSVLDIFC